jgi:hypothetical protein
MGKQRCQLVVLNVELTLLVLMKRPSCLPITTLPGDGGNKRTIDQDIIHSGLSEKGNRKKERNKTEVLAGEGNITSIPRSMASASILPSNTADISVFLVSSSVVFSFVAAMDRVAAAASRSRRLFSQNMYKYNRTMASSLME